MDGGRGMGWSAVGDIVDLAGYPLGDPRGREAVVETARAGMAAEGCAVLPGLVRPEAAARMAAEGLAALPRSHRRDRMLGAYEEPAEADMAADHPRRRRHPYCMHVTATDLLDPAREIRRLHAWDGLAGLIADILHEPSLHRSLDPLLGCVTTTMHAGDQHGWHFDGNDFVVSLLLQAAEAGGAFEFAPGIRGAEDESYEGVKRVMDGDGSLLCRPVMEAGTLVLFRGKESLHWVTPVEGDRPRVIALFSYDRRPDMVFPDHIRMQAVGRAAVA